MRLRRPVTLAALFMTLAFASKTHAECAWVLWGERTTWFTTTTSHTWTLIDTYDAGGELQCKGDVRNKVQDVARVFTKTRREDEEITIEGNVVTLNSPMKSEIVRYLCVPDSVDPRAKDSQ